MVGLWLMNGLRKPVVACCRVRGHDDQIVTLYLSMLMSRKFSREFKPEAVKLVTERDVLVAQPCHDLDLGESVLRRWMRELAQAPASASPSNGQLRAEQAEIVALNKEVTRLKAERHGPIRKTTV